MFIANVVYRQFKLFIYDTTLEEHIVREVNREEAIALLSSDNTRINSTSLLPFKGFDTEKIFEKSVLTDSAIECLAVPVIKMPAMGFLTNSTKSVPKSKEVIRLTSKRPWHR